MKPAPVDLPIIWRNCDWEPIILRWKDVDGNPIDLTRWTPIANTSQFTLNAVKTDAIGGITQMSLTKAQTGALTLGVYQWNWLFSNVDGTVPPPFLSGNVEVKNPIQFSPLSPAPTPPPNEFPFTS